ncbi:DUF11 domain-containing protein [Planctomycetales bacterium ZRK34]|nr:DUF11 domain-containing protein [Planctomycetales bacterium ZRK34]
MKRYLARNLALCCAVLGMLTLVGCASSNGSGMSSGSPDGSGFPQTSKTTVVTQGHPPKDGAKVVQTYMDNLYGKTELRDDDYHRHVDKQSATGWTPWHWRHQAHNWGDEPMPAKAPAPAPMMNHSVMNFPSAVTDADGKSCCGVVTLEKFAPGEVSVGETFEYKLVATNKGSLKLMDVVVTDMLPGDFKVESSNPAVEGVKEGKGVWMLGELEPGASKTITVKGSATKPGRLVNCSTVTFTPYACVATNVIEPALKLTKKMPSDVLLCERIPATFEITNTGTGTARNVVINDSLPKGLVTEAGDGNIKIVVGDLASGASKRYVVNLKPLDTGKYTNKAMASADGGLKSDASASVAVHEPVLKITKTGPEKMFIGKTITYKIKVTNTGDAPAEMATLEDTLPAGAPFVSATDGGTHAAGKVTWNLGTIAPKASKEVSVSVKADNPGTYKDVAMAKAKCAKAVDASAETMVTGIPAILLEVIDLDDPIQVGNNVVYVITVTNQGSAPGTNIVIENTLEDTMQFVSAAGATAGKNTGKTVKFAPIASLAPKAKAEFRVTVKAVKAGDVRFSTKMTSDQISRPVEETEATNFFE